MSELPFAATTPIHVGRVGLIARDADALAAWYRDVVGLHELGRADGNLTMGAGERPCSRSSKGRMRGPTIPAVQGCSIRRSCCRLESISAAGSATLRSAGTGSTALQTTSSPKRCI